MDRETRQQLMDAYKDGYRVVAEALAGAKDEELDTPPGDGKWTAREIVHHLADSEMTSAIRLRLLIASPSPSIVGYDQEEFARRALLRRPAHRGVARRLQRRPSDDRPRSSIGMTEAEWLREGTHTEHGRYTVERWLEIYAAHAHSHAEQILAARDAARKAS